MCLGVEPPKPPDKSCAGKNVYAISDDRSYSQAIDTRQQCCQLIYSESFSEKILSIVVRGNLNVSGSGEAIFSVPQSALCALVEVAILETSSGWFVV